MIKKQKKNKIGLFVRTGIALTMISVLFLVFQISSLSEARHKKMENDKVIAELKEKNLKHEYKVANLKTSQNLKESAMSMDMVYASDINYVSLDGDNVALNR